MSEHILVIHKLTRPVMDKKTYSLKPPKEGYVLMHIQADGDLLYLVWREEDWPKDDDT